MKIMIRLPLTLAFVFSALLVTELLLHPIQVAKEFVKELNTGMIMECIDSVSEVAVRNTGEDNSNVIWLQNPGCESKDLNMYTAIDLGKAYYHPPIVHYAKLGPKTVQLNFREYTSVLSVRKFIRPEEIIFHTYEYGLSGKYWDVIKAWKEVIVKVNKIPRVERIGGKKIYYIQHTADFVKLNMVHKYGGVALDFDVIVINGTRLKYEQILTECVLAGEIRYINGGFYSCVKNSSFIAKWLESYYKDYKPLNWLHNISYRPARLLTNKTSNSCYNVHVDNTICTEPLWPKSGEWVKQNGVKWRNKMAAHYYLKHFVPYDGEKLLKAKFSLAEMIQYVHDS